MKFFKVKLASQTNVRSEEQTRRENIGNICFRI